MGEDEQRIARRLAVQFEENARPPAAVAVVVIVDEKYHGGARGSNESSLWHAEINPEMYKTAGPLEIAALQEVAPVFEIAAVGPLDPEARMEIVEKGLAYRRFEKRVGSTCKPLRVSHTPARCLFVEVYFTERGSAERWEKRGDGVRTNPSQLQGVPVIH